MLSVVPQPEVRRTKCAEKKEELPEMWQRLFSLNASSLVGDFVEPRNRLSYCLWVKLAEIFVFGRPGFKLCHGVNSPPPTLESVVYQIST